MKKILCVLLMLCLCLGLCACGQEAAAPVSHTYEDLTIILPADFIDLSEEAYAAGLAFLQGLDPIAINGIREEKAVFESYGLEMDLARYAKLVTMSNNLGVQPVEKEGILTFSYEATTGGVSYTYVVTMWETEKAFWTVQAYCPTADYSKVKNQMWDILTSVQV